MKKLLFIDACISSHSSRTKKLCLVYVEEFMKKNPDVQLETVMLRPGKFEALSREKIIERDSYVVKKDWNQSIFDHAKQFKEADYILVGTPYWDLSFAAVLKLYIENITVADLTFEATDEGFIGLCNGKKLTYITTAGGFIEDKNFGYDYMVGMAGMYGIKETEFFKAEALDIAGVDVEKIMNEAEKNIRDSFLD